MTTSSTLHIWDSALHGTVTDTLNAYHHGTIPTIAELKTRISDLGVTAGERTIYRWLQATRPNTPCQFGFLTDDGRATCEGVVEYGACTECGRTPETVTA